LQFSLSNHFLDVQKLFSVIRYGSSKIMYTISFFLSYTKRQKKYRIAQLAGRM
jgi:hypothetical protein